MSIRGNRQIFYGVCIAAFICLIFVAFYYVVYGNNTGQTGEKSMNNPNLLMTGGYASADESFIPFLLSIDIPDFSITSVNLDPLNISGISGFHEARPFMINGQYKIVLGSYMKGNVFILGSSDPNFGNLHIELEENFDGERVRAVAPGDVNGDGQDDVVIATRPSGIIKYYTNTNGKWIGSVIDKIGMSIHDVMITNLDGNNEKEIYVTASTTSEYNSHTLSLQIPEIIKYTLVRGTWDKKIIWKPDNPTPRESFPYLYDHSRYMFTGDFTGNGKTELVSGVIGDTALEGLLLLTWNGSGYTHNFQPIEDGIKASTEVITSGDIDGDGKDEILVPTLTGDALLSYTWRDDKWVRSVIAKDLVDTNNDNENVMSVAILNSVMNGYRTILYVTANADHKRRINPKIYTLSYNSTNHEWEKTFIASPNLPMAEIWGTFRMSPWNIRPTPGN